ncbi:MAG: EAL domain-containing protein, partial [Acidimicrobiia bacterium]|nr:EAL domain-containing protein [Acidimicrobiia bacterium]
VGASWRPRRPRSTGRAQALHSAAGGYAHVVHSVVHSLGDELLVAISKRLQARLRPEDVVARIGGDEFVTVVKQVTSLADAMSTAERLLLGFESPFRLRGSDVYSSASIGLVFADPANPSLDPESLIRDADTAMYQAKAAGRDGIAVFDMSMRDRVAERLVLEQDLRTALDAGELHLHFQPIVRLSDETVEGLEALLRWVHPTRGLISPATVIPIAEETGLIIEIGAWVIEEAAREVRRWRRMPGAEHLYVAVNLSARQLRDPRLVERVATTLADQHLEPAALCLELTESMLMEDPVGASQTLHQLRDLGVRLSLDDFGTGYSSLSYLKRFPVDEVKIDRSFVDGLDAPDSSEASLVAAIVAMARALGMKTVAEGVELPIQAQRLRELGADQVQGYLYARPVGPESVPGTLARLGAKRYAALPDIA